MQGEAQKWVFSKLGLQPPACAVCSFDCKRNIGPFNHYTTCTMGCGASKTAAVSGKKDLTFLVIGLDNSGKTTLVEALKGGE